MTLIGLTSTSKVQPKARVRRWWHPILAALVEYPALLDEQRERRPQRWIRLPARADERLDRERNSVREVRPPSVLDDGSPDLGLIRVTERDLEREDLEARDAERVDVASAGEDTVDDPLGAWSDIRARRGSALP